MTGARDTDADEKVRLGLALVRTLEDDEVALPELLDRIEEAVGEAPAVTREVVERAEGEGVLEREDGEGTPRFSVEGTTGVDFDDDVVSKEGEFDCARCGRSITTGYFIKFDDGEVGPYGSTCIRKTLGRE
ncbi:MAG: DUF5830 family protein [Halobacteriales archaeon]